jgi:hypothetical protein
VIQAQFLGVQDRLEVVPDAQGLGFEPPGGQVAIREQRQGVFVFEVVEPRLLSF